MKKIQVMWACLLICLVACNDGPNVDPDKLMDAYPNPCSGHLIVTIANTSTKLHTLQVFDAHGKQLSEIDLSSRPAGFQQIGINATESPNGFIHAILKSDAGTETLKILKE